MTVKHIKFWLVVLVVLVFSVRLWYALSIPGFSSDESYFHLRQVESIVSTGFPFWQDELSWGGRNIFFSPIYDYILSVFSIIFGTELGLKIGAEIISSLLSLFVALLVVKITKNLQLGIFAGIIIAVMPAWVGATLNQLWPQSLIILFLTALFLTLDTIHSYWIALLAGLMHPLSIIWVGVSASVFFLSWLSQVDQKELRKPLIFTSVEILVANTLYWLLSWYVQENVFFGKIPALLVPDLLGSASVLGIIISIGVLPVLIATRTTYTNLFSFRGQSLAGIISLALVSAIIILFAGPRTSLIVLLGVSTALLCAFWCNQNSAYLQKTLLANNAKKFSFFFLLLVIAVTAWPLDDVPQKIQFFFPYKDQLVLSWIAERTPSSATVFSLATEGQRIMALSKRKTVMDTRFSGRSDSEIRAKDIQRLFTTSIELEAVQLLDKYGADYIFLSSNAIKKFGSVLPSAIEKGCFMIIYDLGPKVYEKSEDCKSHTRKS